jgi:hypothetical protein
MKFSRAFDAVALAAALGLSLGLAACGGDDDNAATASGTTLQTLSTRADMVSGGSVLMEVKLPASATAGKLKVTVGSTDVSTAFATRSDGRTVGLVTGLANGANTVTATSTDNSFTGAQLVVTNHPIGGPVLLSTQVTPWVCATPTPTAATTTTAGTNASGLTTAATDAQCNIKTETKLFYRTKTAASVAANDGGCSFAALPDPSPTLTNPNPTTPANSCLQPYVVGTTDPTLVATTTPLGSTTAVPYIVRVERGTINRGIYDIAVLFDPTKPWTANAPQAQWTGKVVYSYGASTGQPRQQFRSEQNWADDSALSRGVMVVDNSLTDSLYSSNRILAAETTMMMKEHIVDTYGEIKYTMGNGCSGGSIGQNTVSSTMPGLLDGIQVQCDFPDSITTGIEVADCVLLVNLYAGGPWSTLMTNEGLTQAQINARKTAINGHLDQTGCHSWNNAFGFNNKPGNYTPTFVANASGALIAGAATNNCRLPASQVYDPVSNPTGPRCGDPDLAVAVWGLAPGTTRANQTNDNVGVQYGLKALLAGAINAEEFVVLNENIGGTDADSNLTAARSVADAAGLTIAYKSGILSSGKQLAKLPIIDLRGYDETGIHYIWRSFSERDRLDQQAGSHANQVMWRFGTGLAAPAALGVQSFLTMDTWLSSLVTSAPKTFVNGERTQAQVVAAKPAAAVDFCYLSTDTAFANRITDFTVCDTDPKLVAHASPHQVAGGPRAENILKCQLKALNFADYTGVTFTAAQQTRLQAAFPAGVCDWSKPGVSQQDPVSPQTYTAGPGGVPLPAAPVSTAI